MTIADYEGQLASINIAIAAIEGGAQEYRIGTRMVRRAELSTLYAERRRLEGVIGQLRCSTTLARIDRRR